GVRGMPRVGKTESIVAGSVSANKKWLFVSSTLLKQTVRNQLIEGGYGEDYIYIIDGVVSQQRASEQHWQLIREIMQLTATKVIEHSDSFDQTTEHRLNDVDYNIEVRREEEEEITDEQLYNRVGSMDESMFEFSQERCVKMKIGETLREGSEEKELSLDDI